MYITFQQFFYFLKEMFLSIKSWNYQLPFEVLFVEGVDALSEIFDFR